MWTLEESVVSIVASSRNTDLRGTPLFKMSTKLKTLRVALKSWNKSIFGHVQTSSKDPKAHIDTLQNMAQTDTNLAWEMQYQIELDDLLKKELLWRKKSKQGCW